MTDNQCFDMVKKQINIIIDRTKNQAMEKPRLLRILFKLLSEGEKFSDYQVALDSSKIKELYRSDKMLTSAYDTVSGELVQTYLRKNPEFVECIFKKLRTEEHEKIHDFIDEKIDKKN